MENGWLELDGGAREPFGLLVWNTGLTANPFVESLEGLSRDEKTKSCVYVVPPPDCRASRTKLTGRAGCM